MDFENSRDREHWRLLVTNIIGKRYKKYLDSVSFALEYIKFLMMLNFK